MAKVWHLPCAVDLGAAEAWGDLKKIDTGSSIYADDNMATVQDKLDRITDSLHGFVPAVDYLVLVGDPAMLVAIGMELGYSGHVIRCLKWDRQAGAYFEMSLNMA